MVFHSYVDAKGEKKELKDQIVDNKRSCEYCDGQIDPAMLF